MTGWALQEEHDRACESLLAMSEHWSARYRPNEPVDLTGVQLPPPSYRGNNPYNGFTAEERVLTDRVMILLRRKKLLPKPDRCELCLSRTRIGYHGENYYDPFAVIQVCFPCHMAIHRRFSAPRAWHRRLQENDWPSISLLPAEQVDFAGWLRKAGHTRPLGEIHPSGREVIG